MHESSLTPASPKPQHTELAHLEEEAAYRRVMRRVGESERAPESLVQRALRILRESRGGRS